MINDKDCSNSRCKCAKKGMEAECLWATDGGWCSWRWSSKYVCVHIMHYVCMFLLYVCWTFSAFWKSLESWRTLGKEEIWLNLWEYLLGSRELRDLPSSIQEGLGTTHNRTQPPRTDTLCLGLVMWCYQSALVLRDLWTMPGGAWAHAVSGMELESLCMEGFWYSVLSSLPGL